MFIYRTTNLINKKIYIGKKEKDQKGYLGSGVYLKNAINKEHFVSLKNSIKQGQNTPIEEDNSNSVDTFEDKIKRGNERYSSK